MLRLSAAPAAYRALGTEQVTFTIGTEWLPPAGSSLQPLAPRTYTSLRTAAVEVGDSRCGMPPTTCRAAARLSAGTAVHSSESRSALLALLLGCDVG